MTQAERNADGSVIMKLAEPITFQGEQLHRVTIPRLRAKHLVTCPAIDADTSIGVIVGWAYDVVEPKGCVDEMGCHDALEVAKELLISLGKSRQTGASPSP